MKCDDGVCRLYTVIPAWVWERLDALSSTRDLSDNTSGTLVPLSFFFSRATRCNGPLVLVLMPRRSVIENFE